MLLDAIAAGRGPLKRILAGGEKACIGPSLEVRRPTNALDNERAAREGRAPLTKHRWRSAAGLASSDAPSHEHIEGASPLDASDVKAPAHG
jgi:hypothetical protein